MDLTLSDGLLYRVLGKHVVRDQQDLDELKEAAVELLSGPVVRLRRAGLAGGTETDFVFLNPASIRDIVLRLHEISPDPLIQVWLLDGD